MSGLPPLIADWQRLRLEWGYLKRQILRPFTVPAGREVQLPTSDYVFSYREGVLLQFTTDVNDPSCGMRIELNPDYDSESDLTVANLMGYGLNRVDPLFYVNIPPQIAAGHFVVRLCSPWIFTSWMRLHVINTDTVSHTCSGFSYNIAVLKGVRPDETIRPLKQIERIRMLYELYPELRKAIKQKIGEDAELMLKGIAGPQEEKDPWWE